MQQIKELFTYGFWDFIINTLIYSVVVLPFFLIFWVFLKPKYQNRRIQEKQRSTPSIIRQEIKNSIITILIFAIIDVALYVAQLNGYTQIYDNVNEYGWGYFVFSILLMILLHDAWFFFTHRLMHHPKLFKYIHKVHHQSTDPSPFAAFSFHPLEAVVEAGAYIIFSFLFPVHLFALLGWQLIQMTLNVIGHLGYEIYPKGFNTHWLFRWKTPSTHHNMHHSNFNGNYGLYFTWWDKIFKTEFKDYNETYEKLQNRIANKKVITIVLFLFTVTKHLQAQNIELNTSLGLSKPYIIESIEEQKDLKIGYAPILSIAVKYKPKVESKWGLLLSLQHFETRAKGITKISQTSVDGFISNTSFLLISEKENPLKRNRNWNFIYSYGFGLSSENYVIEAEAEPRKNTYLSITTYAGLSRKINDRVNFRITDGLLFTDFIKGIHYLFGNWKGQSAGEDISNHLLIGLNYKF
ncbi:MAG: sterol desaturase family protein [Bacteroidetes bacterium]|nr:sterol desaturase family protein [Bacteroidota bacterium]